MTQSIQKLALIYADICGSTALYDKLGDVLARRLISRCITAMTAEIPVYKGTLVKTIGDEIMCTFASVEGAVNAACAMQRAVKNANEGYSHPIHIRVGLHFGDVVCEDDNVFGDTANVAAHVAKITRANQIMATKTVIDALPADLQNKARQIMRSEFAGKQEQFDIFMISWGADELEKTRLGIPAYRKNPENDNDGEMVLQYRDQSYLVNNKHKYAILGREDTCQIIVRNDFASRQHVRIEFRLGKFVVIDQSTNGTYVRLKGGKPVCLTRQELTLEGSGLINLGQEFSGDAIDSVEFSIFLNQIRHE